MLTRKSAVANKNVARLTSKGWIYKKAPNIFWILSALSFDVGVTGLEPATTRPPGAYANQLRHTPNHYGGFCSSEAFAPGLRVQS